MVLKDLLAIAGSPGLYKFIAQGKNAVIVEHLETGKRTSAHGTARVSSLEDVAVFTDTEEVPLAEVFDKIYEKENGAASINHKSSPEELKNYFNELIPEYDRERVYISDMKKIIQWYNILHSLDMLVKEDKKDEEKDEATTTTDSEDLKSEPEKKGAGQRPTPVGKAEASSSTKATEDKKAKVKEKDSEEKDSKSEKTGDENKPAARSKDTAPAGAKKNKKTK